MFGNAHAHDRLVRELSVGARAAVVFPEYDHSSEARYPVAIEQNYTVAQWVVREGASKGLDATRTAEFATGYFLRRDGMQCFWGRFTGQERDSGGRNWEL